MRAVKQKKPSSNYTSHNKIQLVRAGSDYFSLLLKIINHARHALYLQVYILDYDATGKQVANALLEAAKRGVEVYLMVDAYASHTLPRHFVRELKTGGVHFRFFQPFFKSKYFYIGRRMHHKLIVADAEYCMVGGINIGNRYNDMPGQPGWLDFALYIHGQIAREVCLLARQMWEGIAVKKNAAVCAANEVHFTHGAEEHTLVRLRRNDWVRSKSDISKTYREMFSTATSHITILCSYFMPGNMMKKNILRAVKRGVKVKVIMAGRSDVALAKNAERFMYDWLLRNRVEIYEYEQNILHGKLAVCDGRWMTIGSYNINNISAYASVELNLDVQNPPFAEYTERVLTNIINTGCVRITRGYVGKKRSVIKQFINWCSYEIIRSLFFLFTFYFKQRKF
ncbi:MAG TPA: phospholipase D-like domain-containing protein [Chitinophagaceae bacterium]|nr:phospholipase D-like domain-containing protein [Chitinophagaceae bacterium]